MNRLMVVSPLARKIRKISFLTISLKNDEEKSYRVFYKKLDNQVMVCSRCKGRRPLPQIEVVKVLSCKGIPLKINNPTAIRVIKKAKQKLETCAYCRSLN